MQAPGVRFSVKQSVEIARSLAQIGVDMIECGHPSMSSEEMARVSAIAALKLPPPILAHARAHRADIDAVADSGATWVGIFLGVNEISQRVRLHKDEVTILRLVSENIAHARKHGLKVRYTIEDSSRTSLNHLVETYKTALEAGANRICFADTVGSMEPSAICGVVSALRRVFPEVSIEVHLHDDRGLAIANALTAIDAGADWISTSVNGLGERCGITDTLCLLANLQHRGLRQIADPALLHDLSRRVAAFARSPVDTRRPITGQHVFYHTAKLHAKAVAEEEMAYAWTAPLRLGVKQRVDFPVLPRNIAELLVKPQAISATELKHHRHGPGTRYVMIDERFVPDCRQYCIVRRIPHLSDYGAGHVDMHSHTVDSLFLFIGDQPDMTGLCVEVELASERFVLESPASVFIPAGMGHSYRILAGAGYFINHVGMGDYNRSLLDTLSGADHDSQRES
jgi:2-isopropylmalate synthase